MVAKMLHSGLQGSLVSKNVVNLSRRNLTDSEISLLSEGLTYVPTSNTINKSKLEQELEALGTFKLRNKDATIEIHMSSLEEKLMKIEIIKNNARSLQ